jgi:hypothetical protein
MARPVSTPKHAITAAVDSALLARIDHAACEWQCSRAEAAARLLDIGFRERAPAPPYEAVAVVRADGCRELRFAYESDQSEHAAPIFRAIERAEYRASKRRKRMH